jgi:hypothetical protein
MVGWRLVGRLPQVLDSVQMYLASVCNHSPRHSALYPSPDSSLQTPSDPRRSNPVQPGFWEMWNQSHSVTSFPQASIYPLVS